MARMVLAAVALLLLPSSAAAAAAACPPSVPSLVASGVAWNGSLWTVCQHSIPGGALQYIAEATAATIEIERSAEALYDSNPTWLNFTEDDVKNNVKDIMGNRLLERGNPTFAEIKASAPPLVMSSPDSIKGDPPTGTAHTFVSSRSSSEHVSFDVMGSDINGMGHPGMSQEMSKYHRSFGIFKDALDSNQQQEGLWGGFLPITTNYFKIKGAPAPQPGDACKNGTSTVPRPCKEKGHTFCPSDGRLNQCQSPPVATCPPCAPPPPGRACTKPCVHHPGSCCSCTGGEAPCPHDPSKCCKASPRATTVDDQHSATNSGGGGLEDDSDMTAGSDDGSAGGYIEMTVCPVADMQGNMEQAAFFRFQKTSANGTVLRTQYYDTFACVCIAHSSCQCPSLPLSRARAAKPPPACTHSHADCVALF
jgi:hypothetical protein